MPPLLASRRRRWIARLALSVLSLVITVAVLELLLALAGFEHEVTVQHDPHCGYAHVPNAVWHQTSEGSATVRTNRFGFCDKEWTVEKPRNTVRIAVLGDSFVEGQQVESDARLTARLEAELERLGAFPGRKVEVMNFGCSGYGTAQELLTFRHAARQFQPDVVVLGFLSGNDVRNNSRALERDPVRPYFTVRDGQLQLDDSFRRNRQPLSKRIGFAAARYSRLGQLAYRVYQALGVKATLRQMQDRSEVDWKLVELGLNQPGLPTAVYKSPEPGDWHDAWLTTETLVKQLREEVEAAGAEFLVATLSNSIQVHPQREKREQFQHIAGIDDLFYPDRRLQNFCDRAGIKLVNLAPAMQRYAEEQGVFLHGFENTTPGTGHWNAEGHRVASSLVARWMLERSSTVAAYRQSSHLRPSANVIQQVSATLPATTAPDAAAAVGRDRL